MFIVFAIRCVMVGLALACIVGATAIMACSGPSVRTIRLMIVAVVAALLSRAIGIIAGAEKVG
jgi:hypothetical protein